MNIINTNEPSMDKIDDYYGNESKSKKLTINLIILGLIACGVLLSFTKTSLKDNPEYIGTQESPGIIKKFK